MPGGLVNGEMVLEGQRRFDLLVRLDEPYRSDYGNLARLQLELPGGRGKVALGELAYRRTGLAFSLVAILLVVVALALKIRSLEHPREDAGP